MIATSFTIKEKLLKRLDNYCVETSQSRSYVMRKAIGYYLENAGKNIPEAETESLRHISPAISRSFGHSDFKKNLHKNLKIGAVYQDVSRITSGTASEVLRDDDYLFSVLNEYALSKLEAVLLEKIKVSPRVEGDRIFYFDDNVNFYDNNVKRVDLWLNWLKNNKLTLSEPAMKKLLNWKKVGEIYLQNMKK